MLIAIKIIAEKDSLVTAIMGAKEYNPSEIYRPFSYVLKLQYREKVLLLNTLTRQMVALTSDEYDELNANHCSDLFRKLVNDWFFVPSNFDDVKLKQETFGLVKMLTKRSGITQFVIMPTMECNARCFYCFEHGSKRYPMSEATAQKVADFILEKACGKKIKIQWFGGEPLFNSQAIDIITARLNAENQPFDSIMISNGYLFDQSLIDHAITDWHLNRVQITLDGTEEIYNRVKAYIYRDVESPFIRVTNNIELLAKSGVRVQIRLNLDEHNTEDLSNLIEYLGKRFAFCADKISTYVWLLYDNRGAVKTIRDDLTRIALTERLIELEKRISELGIGVKGVPHKSLPTVACLADNDCSTVVLPDGHLGKCDHHSDDEFWGSIDSTVIDNDLLNSWKVLRDEGPLCKTCPLYPQCLKLKKCPDDGAYDCDVALQRQRMEKEYQKMRNAYDKAQNNLLDGAENEDSSC